MFARTLGCVVGFCCAVSAASAAEPSLMTLMQLDKGLHYQTGDVPVGGSLATLHLGQSYRFLDADNAKKVIVDGWGNPPGAADGVLGMIAPAKASPLAVDSWGVVVSYAKEGHVDDADAAKIDYGDLLGEMKSGIESHNDARKGAGYEPMHLVGWARQPTYDAAAKKLIWAKEIAFEGSSSHTLNYDVRVLGRRGVLSLNAVGVMGDLPKFETAMADVSRHAEFNGGERYADYSASSGDKMAAYGVAGLIAGGVAAKAGLFKILIGLLIAAKKLVIIAVVAIVAAVKKGLGALTGRRGQPAAVAARPVAGDLPRA